MSKLSRISVFIAALGLAACSDATGPADGSARMSIAFRSAGVGSAAVVPDGGVGVALNQTARALSMTGTNGTLQLDEVWLIMAEFELERLNHDDCDDVIDEDACEEFSAPPQFLQLPLDGGSVPAVSQTVPADVYDELEFEIEDIELDDDEDPAVVQALFDEIRAQIPDWPEEASMLVVGSFTPTGGAATPFRVFFEAEVEIEQELDPPLDLTTGDATVTVVVDPALWFVQGDGTVMDLSQFIGQVVEFEAEFENGFADIEFDHDEDDD